ncbi:MAG: T9SS type A sorting domain-containing protein [Flavobacteriales bacterium]|nr:T9SS type A sorting domain-containing protein [Flavobacteriales bacterium]
MHTSLSSPFRPIALLVSAGFAWVPLQGQTLTSEFVSAGYSLSDLGSITDLPTPYGGLTIRADEPNTLYIGGSANASNGAIYAVPLIRDGATDQITGFAGPAVFHSTGPNNDGGLTFTPSGTLLFTQYTPFSMNSMGQILPDNSYVTTELTSLGVSPSVGSHAFVPDGYPGAGGLIVASYNASIAYRIPFTVEATGLHIFSAPTSSLNMNGTATGPEGIAYVPLGSVGFPVPSMVMSAYGMNKVVVFEVGADGLPNIATARDMVVDLVGAEGAWIDPLTGDFLFSTFGGSNRVIRVTGFELPTAMKPLAAQQSSMFHVFPNPSNGSLQLALARPGGIIRLEIIDPQGATIISQSIAGGCLQHLDLSSRAPGLYLVRVQCDGAEQVQRVVVE